MVIVSAEAAAGIANKIAAARSKSSFCTLYLPFVESVSTLHLKEMISKYPFPRKCPVFLRFLGEDGGRLATFEELAVDLSAVVFGKRADEFDPARIFVQG